MNKVDELKAKSWDALRAVEVAFVALQETAEFKSHRAAQEAFEKVKIELAKAELNN